ncbi:MAG: GNAT family N-acetyltransferase [Spirochaetes bacterium]|jgi:predicted N-acyltransferase|nr:GNAT family N-acetyltransferase [Spirochaetota bacterium]
MISRNYIKTLSPGQNAVITFGVVNTRRSTQLAATWHSSIKEISREEWNALATPLETPLLEWDWLHQLEASGSISPDEGWIPVHLTLREEDTLVAAAPLYVKTHSMGEFVFDFAWADVARQVGTQYYPKLVGMSPATPSTAFQFLIHPDYDAGTVTWAMLEQIEEFCKENRIRTMAFNYVDHEWRQFVEEYGFTTWKHQSYQWINHGFDTFDDYLAIFRKNQRKNIRKERRSVGDLSIRVEPILGTDAPDRFFSLMYELYEIHNDQFGPWAAKFLNRRFFEGLADSFRHRVLFVPAYHAGSEEPFAMSFLLTKRDQLLGRYWGAFEHIDNVHFEACYYAPIQWAIEQGVRVFDPGMGSSHKVRRGFEAVENYSLHRFLDEQMNVIMRSNIDRINGYEQQNIDYLNEAIPFAADRDPRS